MSDFLTYEEAYSPELEGNLVVRAHAGLRLVLVAEFREPGGISPFMSLPVMPVYQHWLIPDSAKNRGRLNELVNLVKSKKGFCRQLKQYGDILQMIIDTNSVNDAISRTSRQIDSFVSEQDLLSRKKNDLEQARSALQNNESHLLALSRSAERAKKSVDESAKQLMQVVETMIDTKELKIAFHGMCSLARTTKANKEDWLKHRNVIIEMFERLSAANLYSPALSDLTDASFNKRGDRDDPNKYSFIDLLTVSQSEKG
ncbi:MAG: hypothetical protein CMH98_03730 [Oceanospirillaceae bacterium]|nr:hypothetical protein [Oceanospirillaceae bacterium]